MLDNQIGDDGAIALFAILAKNQSITYVALLGNKIGAKAAEFIASALKTNSTLTALDLTKNEIGDKGATAIFQTLSHANKTLTTLQIGCTWMYFHV